MAQTGTRQRQDCWRATLVCLLLLVASQFALASHHHAHDDHDAAAEVCVFCVQANELEHPVPAPAGLSLEHRKTAALTGFESGRIAGERPSDYDSRAPPLH